MDEIITNSTTAELIADWEANAARQIPAGQGNSAALLVEQGKIVDELYRRADRGDALAEDWTTQGYDD